MLISGFDGQITTIVKSSSAREARISGCGARFGSANKDDFAHRRRAVQSDKIILKVEPALFRQQPRAHRIVAHRQHPRSDPEPLAEIVGDRRQAFAAAQPAGALNMGGEIAVAELEPGLAAKRFERRHKGPGLAAPAPAGVAIVEAGERIEQVSTSGEIDRPKCSKSSPVLATTVSAPGGRTR